MSIFNRDKDKDVTDQPLDQNNPSDAPVTEQHDATQPDATLNAADPSTANSVGETSDTGNHEATPDVTAPDNESGGVANASDPKPDASKDNPADSNAVDSQVNPEPGTVVSNGDAGSLSIEQPTTQPTGSSTPAGSVDDEDGKLSVRADQSLASAAADPDVTVNGSIGGLTYTVTETSAKSRLPGTYADIEVEFSDTNNAEVETTVVTNDTSFEHDGA